MMSKPCPRRIVPLAALAFTLAAVFFVCYSFWTAFHYGLAHLYTDQWRIMATLLDHPFPQNLLESQNGHHPVLPSLIHYISVFVFHQDQRPAMWVGFGIAVTCVFWSGWVLYRSESLSCFQKALLWSVATMALLHSVNGRLLYYANDSVHTYLVVLPLMVGIWLLATAKNQRKGWLSGGWTLLTALAVLGVVGVFSFGAGAVLFPTFVVTALLAKERLWFLAALVLAGAVVIVTYLFLLPGQGVGKAGVQTIEPSLLQWLGTIPRMMSAPLVHMLEHHVLALALPESARASLFHLVRQWVGPALFVAAFLYLARHTIRQLINDRSGSALELYYLSLTIASVAIGLLVCFVRRILFLIFPSQAYQDRFMVWSMLFWLAFFSLLYLRSASTRSVTFGRIGLAGVVLFVLLMVGSNTHWEFRQQLKRNSMVATQAALRSSMNIHADYWESIGLPAELFTRVSEGFRRREIPIIDPVFDSRYLMAFPSEPGLDGSELNFHETVLLENSRTNSPAVYVTASMGNEAPVVYILSDTRQLVGILVLHAAHGSPMDFIRGRSPERLLSGYIHPFDSSVCYSYIFRNSAGVYVSGSVSGPGMKYCSEPAIVPAG